MNIYIYIYICTSLDIADAKCLGGWGRIPPRVLGEERSGLKGHRWRRRGALGGLQRDWAPILGGSINWEKEKEEQKTKPQKTSQGPN